MKKIKFNNAIEFAKHELELLCFGYLVAVFFFGITALGSEFAIEGDRYIFLFESLMGHDYLIMGFMGYLLLLSIAGIIYTSAPEIVSSNLGFYSRAILAFPFIGAIAPASIYVIYNIVLSIFSCSGFVVSGEVGEKSLIVWFLIICAYGGLYFTLCLLPFIFDKYMRLAELKVTYYLLLISAALVVLFVIEKLFFNTSHALYVFFVAMVIFFIFICIAVYFKMKA